MKMEDWRSKWETGMMPNFDEDAWEMRSEDIYYQLCVQPTTTANHTASSPNQQIDLLMCSVDQPRDLLMLKLSMPIHLLK